MRQLECRAPRPLPLSRCLTHTHTHTHVHTSAGAYTPGSKGRMAAAAASAWPSTALVSATLLFCLIEGRRLCGYVADWFVYLIVIKPFLKHHCPQDGKYQKELQVIICGFPRTGTMSTMLAMQILGYPCIHALHFAKPSTNTLFEKAMKSGMAKHWKAFVHGYGAITDWPGAVAYKELMKVYPNAKLILTIRNPDKWYTSFSQTIVQSNRGYTYFILKIFNSTWHMTFQKYFSNKVLKGRLDDRESCIETYRQHIQAVEAHVDPHRLLVYEVGKDDGWKSLCDFLNVPHPNVPFPSSNDRKSFRSLIRKCDMVRTLVAISYVVLAVLSISFILT